jgi:GAF domain-containing protein/two-component sensor histidine kinase
MDVTTPSPQTHNWELLVHLALLGRDTTPDTDMPTLVQQLVALLHAHLPHPWGVLVGAAHGTTLVWDCWGLQHDDAAALIQANGKLESSQGTFYPLRVGHETIGHILLSPSEGTMTAADQSYYQAIAAQIGLLLHTQQRTTAAQTSDKDPTLSHAHLLDTISQQMTRATNLPDLLGYIADTLVCSFAAERCQIALYHADYQKIGLLLESDGSQDSVVTASSAIQPDSPLAQILETGQSWHGQNDAASHCWWMGAPMLTGHHQVIGAVVLYCATALEDSESERAFLDMVARQIALGVQNIYMLTQVEDQILQFGMLNFVSNVAASSQDIEAVYTAVIDTVVQVTGVDQAQLMLYDWESEVGYVAAEYALTGQNDIILVQLESNPIIGRLARHPLPLIEDDIKGDPLAHEWRVFFGGLDVHSVTLIPLLLSDRVVGNIGLAFVGRQEHFNSHQLEFCQTIANQLAMVIEKDHLFGQAQSNAYALQVKVSELSTLLESAGILGSLLRPEEVITSLTDLVSRQLSVTSVAIWTMRSGDVLKPIALYGLNVDTRQDLQLPVGRGLTGQVAESGLPLVVPDVNEHSGEYFPSFFEVDSDLKAFMGVPIFYQDQVIGVLSVMSQERREFTSDEMMILTGLASQAAVALQNARLFQERERRIGELTTINQITTAVNATFEVDELLLTLHKGISEVLNTGWSLIGFYEEPRMGVIDDSLVRMRVVQRGSEVQVSDQIVPIDGRGLIDEVVLTSQPLLLQTDDEIQRYVRERQLRPNDWTLDSRELSALDEPFRCWLSVPILQGGHVLGIINLQHHHEAAYDADDMRFLSTIAGQAAVAISNARLFSERERRLRELSILKDIGSAISSTLDMNVLLANLRYELGQAIDVTNSMFGLYDEKTNTINYPVCYNQGRPIQVDSCKLPDDVSGWVIRNRQPLLLHTYAQGRQIGFSGFGASMLDVRSAQSQQRLFASRQMQSFLAVPIISGDSVLGVINIQSYMPYAFDQDDLRFVVTVANQAAVTISNMYLFMERGKRIDELATFNEISRALSATVSLEDLPELIYHQTGRLLDTTNFAMALLDEAHESVSFPLLYERNVRYPVPSPNEYGPIYEGNYRFPRAPQGVSFWNTQVQLTRRVIDRGEPLLVQGEDTLQSGWFTELRELRDGIGTPLVGTPHFWLGVPMVVANRVVGVISLHSYNQQHTYTSDDVRLLSTIVSSATIALENARLFEQISNLAADLERRVEDRTTELADANLQLIQEKERLETVHAITLELTASLDLNEIIGRALEMASTNLGVSRGSIMMRDPQDGSLVCRAVLQDQGIVHATNMSISFTNGEGLSNWVIQNQEPVCVGDVRQDKRWVVEAGRADEVRSVVAVPLNTSDTTLGVLILSSPYINYFTEAQQRLLATIANEVAIAINNAQLYNYITEMASRLAELLEQQKEETSKSRSILQSMTEGVIVLDKNQCMVLINAAAEHMLHISAQALRDQPLGYLAQQGDTAEEQERTAAIYEVLSTGLKTAKDRDDIYRTSFELLHPNQTIAVSLSPVTALDGGIYGDVMVLRDITPEIEADRTKRQFISDVSHELRTPLTAIRGYVDLLRLSVADDLTEEQLGFLQVIKSNANRLMDLINDILDISRFESGKIVLNFAPVDIDTVIYEVEQTLRLEARKKQMDVHIDIADGLPSVEADQKRLTQVVTNLFSNAIKYTFDEGTVTVRAFLNPAQLMQIEVEDSGVGMSQEQLQKLFRPFYRAFNPLSDRSGGTGLGLSIARSLVELHGGEMWVNSEPGKGSTFSVVLPLTQANNHAQADEDNE